MNKVHPNDIEPVEQLREKDGVLYVRWSYDNNYCVRFSISASKNDEAQFKQSLEEHGFEVREDIAGRTRANMHIQYVGETDD